MKTYVELQLVEAVCLGHHVSSNGKWWGREVYVDGNKFEVKPTGMVLIALEDIATGVDGNGYDAIWPTKTVFVPAGNSRVVVSGLHVEGNMKRMLTEEIQ